jgi:hypothetical protein
LALLFSFTSTTLHLLYVVTYSLPQQITNLKEVFWGLEL